MPEIMGQQPDRPVSMEKANWKASNLARKFGFDAGSPIYIIKHPWFELSDVLNARPRSQAKRIRPCDLNLPGGVYVILIVDTITTLRPKGNHEPKYYVEGWMYDEVSPLKDEFQYARVRVLLAMHDKEKISTAFVQQTSEQKRPMSRIDFIVDRH